MESALHSTNGKFELQGSFGTRRSELPALLGQEPLTRFLKSEPTVNFTVFEAAIWIGSRVCGFIPVRAFRADGANVPKPGSVTLSPSATADCTDEMNAFRALSASVLLKFAPLAIDSTSSPLFTGRTSAHSPCVRDMRTQSDMKVKHSRTCTASIDHCSREVCNAFEMSDERDSALDGQLPGAHLDDGRYDAFILAAETREHGVALSCTITTGPHRGDVVDLVSSSFAPEQFGVRDPFDLVGLPCTLVVDGDAIRIEE